MTAETPSEYDFSTTTSQRNKNGAWTKKRNHLVISAVTVCVCVSEWLCQRVSVHKIQFSEIHILPNSIENPIHIICIRICMFFIGEKRGKNNFKWLTFLWFVSDVRVHTEVKKKK